jgi:hypothetical protein
MAIKIPVFLSAPTTLNSLQQAIYDAALNILDDENLQPRALGRSDFPQSDPLTEVYYVARACYGGIVLGFAQIEFDQGVMKRGSPAEKPVGKMTFPTPWNQIEAGILIALKRPLLVFVEEGVTGGVFDQGAFSGYLQRFRPDAFDTHDREQMRERIRLWSAAVRTSFRN